MARDVTRPALHMLTIIAMMMAALVLTPRDAQAQQVRKKFKDKIHVIQKKPVLQKKRFDLAPRFGMSINDSVYQSFKVGAAGTFHITERVGISGSFDWYDFGSVLGGATSAYEESYERARVAADTPIIDWTGGLEITFVPIFGKFAIFNSGLVFYDVTLHGGAAAVNAESLQLPTPGIKVGGMIGITNHIFLSRWLSLNFDITDTIFSATLQGAPDGALSHVVTFSGGLGIYLPTDFKYEGAEEDDED
jgi:outer membrane beta-barrel protein